VIFPYSVGDYLAQAFHSAKCFRTTCKATTAGAHKGEICLPTGSDNLFGCNIHGVFQLNEINSTDPTTPFPPTASSTINSGFSATFQRVLFEVVKSPEGTIPTSLKALFGPKGFFCTKGKTDLADYGFLTLPNGTSPGDCGFAG
jgi:hypothetical protein